MCQRHVVFPVRVAIMLGARHQFLSHAELNPPTAMICQLYLILREVDASDIFVANIPRVHLQRCPVGAIKVKYVRRV